MVKRVHLYLTFLFSCLKHYKINFGGFPSVSHNLVKHGILYLSSFLGELVVDLSFPDSLSCIKIYDKCRMCTMGYMYWYETAYLRESLSPGLRLTPPSSPLRLHRYWDRLIGYRLIGQHPPVSVSDVLLPIWPIINCACAKLIIATC